MDRLSAGIFDSSLYQNIEAAKHFLLILSPGALDRCCDPTAAAEDWVHKVITRDGLHGLHGRRTRGQFPMLWWRFRCKSGEYIRVDKGGSNRQLRLLQREGVLVVDGRVSLRRFQWQLE